MALSQLPNWRTEKINRLIIEMLHNKKMSFTEFFNLNLDDWQKEFQLNRKEIEDLNVAKSELPNYSFLAESLL